MVGKLTVEVYLLKREGVSGSQEKRRFISIVQPKIKSTGEMANLMGISRAIYCYWLRTERKKRAETGTYPSALGIYVTNIPTTATGGSLLPSGGLG